MDVTTLEMEGGEHLFALRLEHLHPDRRLDAEDVTRDGVAFVMALEGQRHARFVLQTLCRPDPEHPETGRLDIHLLVVLEPSEIDIATRATELCDDLLDLLAAPPVRWEFSVVDDLVELGSMLQPVGPHYLAEVARREEPCVPIRWEGGVGFLDEPGHRMPERSLWSMWTLGPATADLRRLGSVLLNQEAPVCIRVSLIPSSITDEERQAIEELSASAGPEIANGRGLRRASLHTLESLLFLRPVFDVRCVVASPEPLSSSMLSALGHAISEPSVHGTEGPVLAGGFAVLRGGIDVDRDILVDAFSSLSGGSPVPSLAPSGLERLRRLLGPWEAANIFRIPTADDDGFPGIETLQIPDLEVPVAELARTGHRIGHLVGGRRSDVLLHGEDRFRHLYVSGQTGTGKSTLLLNLALQDIESGAGVAVLDPHGDLVEALLGRIPDERRGDVVLVDPADSVAVAGVNLLEAESPVQEQYIVAELCAMFYALFDPHNQGIVGPRFETWLRQAALLLLANAEQPSSFLDITTVFTDKSVREALLADVDDPVLLEFWKGEVAQTSDYHRSEVLGWFRSKFEVFRTSPMVRNVIGQGRSTFSFGDVMNKQQILLVNLSKGELGEYNSALLGHVVFSRLWSAALERASMPASQRRDFFLYVDEFQNMTTRSLPSVLSEARKFRVGLVLANQFFSQIPEATRDAIMGNVGSRITFRLGPKDSRPFAAWLGDEVDSQDLTRLPNHVAVGALSNRGIPVDPFPFRTDPPEGRWDEARATANRERSRELWAEPVGTLDPLFFSRWAHVPGSTANRLLSSGRSVKSPFSTTGGSGPPVTSSAFIDRWVLGRLELARGERVDLSWQSRPDAGVVRQVRALRHWLQLDVEDAVEMVGQIEAVVERGVERARALSLMYEMRHEAEITVRDAERTDEFLPYEDSAQAFLDGVFSSLSASETLHGASVSEVDVDTPIEYLDLSLRARVCLLGAGIRTVGEVVTRTGSDLLAIVNLDGRNLEEIESELSRFGFALLQEDVASGAITDDWLGDHGFGRLTTHLCDSLRSVLYEELESRVGSAVSGGMSGEDLELFEQVLDRSPQLAVRVLSELSPDHPEIVASELERLGEEVRQAAPAVIEVFAHQEGWLLPVLGPDGR